MTLSKKKSRPIIVDNEKYRWLISPREKGVLAFIAEKENVDGGIIEVKIESDINEFWIEFPIVNGLNIKVIKPNDAEFIIKQAQYLGWNPNEKGEPKRSEFDGKKLIIASK